MRESRSSIQALELAMAELQVDVLVCGVGTGGTITGTGRYMREKNPNIKVRLKQYSDVSRHACTVQDPRTGIA